MRTIITERAVRLAETKAKAIDLLGSECKDANNEYKKNWSRTRRRIA
jgi:hypothetical protein